MLNLKLKREFLSFLQFSFLALLSLFLTLKPLSAFKLDEDALATEIKVSIKSVGNAKAASQTTKVKELGELLQQADCQITSLSVSRTSLGIDELRVLTPFLIKNKSLQALSIEWNKLDRAASYFLATFLASNTTLKSFRFTESIDPLCLQPLAAALLTHPSLNELSLRCDLGDESLEYLCEVFQKNTVLEKVDISGNNITDKGASSLLAALIRRNVFLDLKFGDLFEGAVTGNKFSGSLGASIKHLVDSRRPIEKK